MKTLNKYAGVYAGVVVGTRDPQNKGRVRVQIPQILGAASSTWADPMGGVNTPPVLGDRVNIQFLGGDVTRPVFSTYDVTRPWEDQATLIQSLQASITALTPTAWSSIPLASGYVAASFGYAPQWRWSIPNLQVELRGLITPSTVTALTTNATIATMPSGTPAPRPAQLVYHVAATSQESDTGGSVRLEVETDGDIILRFASSLPWNANSPAWVALDGFRYDIV